MAKPRVLVCTRQICRVWKLRMFIYIYIIYLCVCRHYLIIGSVEVEMILSNNPSSTWICWRSYLTHLTPRIFSFQKSTFWGSHWANPRLPQCFVPPPRPSKRGPLQSLWSWWCCGWFEAGGHNEHAATGDPLQKQPGHVGGDFTKVMGVYHWYTNYTRDIMGNMANSMKYYENCFRVVLFVSTVPSTWVWRNMSLARNMICLYGEFAISPFCCRGFLPTYVLCQLVKSPTVGGGGIVGTNWGYSIFILKVLQLRNNWDALWNILLPAPTHTQIDR